MTNIRLQLTNSAEDLETLKLLASIRENHRLNRPFNEHVEYKNFKLNDPKYLNALSLLSDPNELRLLIEEFATHYNSELVNSNDQESQEKFIKLSDQGNTKNVTKFKAFPISFYLGVRTKTPELFTSPELFHYLDRDIQYGLDISYYLKFGEFRQHSYTYLALTNTRTRNNILDNVLRKSDKYNDFYEKLNGLIYTTDIKAIPNHYMEDILDEIDPEQFTNAQIAQYLSNVYRYSLRFETETSSLAERIAYMNEYCAEIKEWPSIKKQILILNDLTDITFKEKEIVLSLLTKIDNSAELPDIEFNT